jgi:hypothetical protein
MLDQFNNLIKLTIPANNLKELLDEGGLRSTQIPSNVLKKPTKKLKFVAAEAETPSAERLRACTKDIRKVKIQVQ